MAYTVVDNEVRHGDKVLDKGSDHRDAVGAAQDRAKSGRTTAVRPTAHVTVSLDFDDAETFVSIVDLEAAQAQDLAGETDQAEILRLMKRKSSEIENAHRFEVQAKPSATPFEHAGRRYAAGDWVLLHADRRVEALTDAEFRERFKAASTSTTKKDGGKSAPSES